MGGGAHDDLADADLRRLGSAHAIACATAPGSISITAILWRSSGSVLNSVAVAPRQTIVARTSGPISWRSTSHSACTPALVAAKTPWPGTHLIAAVEVTVTK